VTNKTKEAKQAKKLLAYEENLAAAKQQMSNSTSHFMLKQPFYGTLLCNLEILPSLDVDTMATNGTFIKYSPLFVVKKLNTQTTRGVTLHELLHVIMKHPLRRQYRDVKRWNIACDYAINPIVIRAGYALPRDALLDPKYDNLSAEAIYNRLPEDLSDIKIPKWGIVEDAPDGESTEIEAKLDIAISQAAEIAKQRGIVPGDMDGVIAEVKSPLVDWRNMLYSFVKNINDNDYSWRRPNRAYISEDEYFPSLFEEVTGTIVVVADTSGSCVQEFSQFWGEICAMHQETKPDKLIFIQCDYDIQGEPVEFTRDDYITKREIHVQGCGGTSFKAPFELIDEKYSNDVDVVIYLTDLYGDFPDEPAYPVLWVSINKEKAPWGTTVYMHPIAKDN
jgi:predicted metal-dependent peptidase|tara:strand:- start:1078 stop:2250 length:1173 start_codon:yes stop_codon:yes gene_type:complete